MRSTSTVRIHCLHDVVLEWQGKEAILRKKTIKERWQKNLGVFLVGTAICSMVLFAGWGWFALFEISLCSVILGNLFLESGEVLARIADQRIFYSSQESAPIASLWQREGHESDSYWTEFGFVDVTGNESTVIYADEALASWKCWRELADGAGLSWENRSAFIAPQR